MRQFFLGCAALAAIALAATPASADTTTDWWETAHRYWLAGQGAPGPRSPDAERAATRATLAMFEAVNAIDRRYQSYLGFPAADRTASQDAAAATAAYKVLLKHYPANKAALDESYTLSMAQIAEGPAREAGMAIGEKAAEAAMNANGIDPAMVQQAISAAHGPGRVGGDRAAVAGALLGGIEAVGDPQRRRIAPAAAAGAGQRALCPRL